MAMSNQKRSRTLPIGEKLAELRRRTKKSASAAAEAAKISRQHLWRIENGLVPSPGVEVLTRLASIYGVSVGRLLGEARPGPSSRGAAILNRLSEASDAFGEEDWETLDELVRRATAAHRSRQAAARSAKVRLDGS